LNGGKWNGLGIYPLIAGASYTVTITSQPNPSSTCADAVKFTYLGNAVGYVAVGDSITAGSHDDISSDGIGYEPILGNLLTAAVANEGVSGTSSADGVASISSVMSKYPSANYYLVMYGSNDAYHPAVPSGMGLLPGAPGYANSYKDNLQKII
jgi:lysophospholipase L1-like esterase